MTKSGYVIHQKHPLAGCGPMGHVTYAQKRFFSILALTAFLCIVVELFFTSQVQWKLPPYSRSLRHITLEISPSSRFGNLMFNYASLLGIARSNGMVPVLPADFPLRPVFQLSMRNGSVVSSLGAYMYHREFGKRGGAYDVRTKRLPSPFDIVLSGYYQSWHYFVNVSRELKRDFTFFPHIRKTAIDFLNDNVPENLQGKDITRIGIHIRRGDHSEPYYIQYGYTVAPLSYIENAMKYFSGKYADVMFVVCSDDIVWSKENIKGKHIVFSENHNAITDFAILSHCDHMIMTVGSFGWWAAWLANGTTVYYKNWPRPLSMLEYEVNKAQYFPPHWIPME